MRARPRTVGPTRISAVALVVIFGLSSLLVVAAPVSAGAPRGVHVTGSGSVVKITDESITTHGFGTLTSTLWDNETTPPSPSRVRTYEVSVATSVANFSQAILLQTDPTSFWSDPQQMPDGADNLPPLSEWTWWVDTQSGVNDTSNWTVDPTGTLLERAGFWVNQSYVVFGVSHPTIDVNITPALGDGARATGGGFVINAAGYSYSLPSTAAYGALGASLDPTIIRFGLDTASTFTGWDSVTHQPILSFKGLDSLFAFRSDAGGQVVLSLPAGNWGDGNIVPSGTPLNTAVNVTFHSFTGNFVTPAVEYALVRQVTNHTASAQENVTYWSVGNEVPLNSTPEADAYAQVINAAIDAVHVRYPNALVGTDDMMSSTYLSYFAKHTPSVGFLSFHWYQSWGMCVNPNSTYCPPEGAPNGTPTPVLFQHPAYTHGASNSELSPVQAQDAWYNATGKWLPVLNTETNLGAFGSGGSPTQSTGTDPRIPDLTGAAWLGSTLVDSSLQNVSALSYFTLTSSANISSTITYARGGFGYGLTNVTSAGTITLFAPYYVLKLWDQYLPAGAKGLSLTDTDSGSIRAFAVLTGGQVNVALVSRVGVPISVKLGINGHFALKQVTTLDSESYGESYNATSDTTSVVRSGVSVAISPSEPIVSFPGYGFAIAQFVPSGISGNGTNQSGGGNTSSSASNATGSILGGSGSAHLGTPIGPSPSAPSASGPASPSGSPAPLRTGHGGSAPRLGGTPAGTGPLTSAASSTGLPLLGLAAVGILAVAVVAAASAGRAARGPPRRPR